MGISIKGPKKFKVKLIVPTNDRKLWGAVGQEIATRIHKRTLNGRDVDGHQFKRYDRDYAKKKAEGFNLYEGAPKNRGGRPTRISPRGFGNVNLTLTGRMLKSLAKGVRAGRDNASVTLSGEEGFKAFMIEKGGREFVGLTDSQLRSVFKRIDKWIARKNKL